jgi:hypothetical protein
VAVRKNPGAKPGETVTSFPAKHAKHTKAKIDFALFRVFGGQSSNKEQTPQSREAG